MPDNESWEKYGFPDDIMFRTPYLPWVGLIKALNERLQALNLALMDIPEYFTIYGGMAWESNYSAAWSHILTKTDGKGNKMSYVNPAKIASAARYNDCFWTSTELEQEALNGEEKVNVTSFMRPKFSVKWAVWQYNQTNLLRYVVTSDPDNWPDVFTYTDLNSSFAFKAP